MCSGIYPPATPIPFVYFASQDYTTHWLANYQFPATAATALPASGWAGQGSPNGNVRPYLLDNGAGQINPPYFANPNSFQIISAGVDDDYGAGSCFLPQRPRRYARRSTAALSATILQYTPGDKDNLTNFSARNLGDSLPQPWRAARGLGSGGGE